MTGFDLHDKNPLSKSSHCVEMRKGFTLASRLMVEDRDGEWWVYGVHTPPAYRGQGLAGRLISYVESSYGPFAIESENDAFWVKQGFERCSDGLWRRSS